MADCCARAKAPPRDHRWLRIGAGALIAGNSMLVSLAINSSEVDPATWLGVHLGLLGGAAFTMALLAPPLCARAARQLRRGRVTTELLFVGGVGAALAQSLLSIARGHGETYLEIVSLLLVVYSLGAELSRGAQKRALRSLDRLRPRQLEVAVVDGEQLRAARVAELRPGAVVRLAPRATIPIDGTIVAGSALVREAEVTGEPIARRKVPGDAVVAGTELVDAPIDVRLGAAPGLLDRIEAAIEAARRRPSRIERVADQMASRLFPAVAAAALLTLCGWGLASSWARGVEHALAVVLIACPCALGFATPLVMWSTTAALARRGVELRSGESLEALAAVDTVVFDKTGTLTATEAALDRFEVHDSSGVASLGGLVAAVEAASDHPYAAALAAAGDPEKRRRYRVDELRVLAGRGVLARVCDTASGREHQVGIGPAAALIDPARDRDEIAVVVDGRHRATATVGESMRPQARRALRALRDAGFELHLLSGDRGARVARVAGAGFSSASSEVSPLEKLAVVDALEARGRRVMFVGDGVNDAAVLAAASVGLAMRSGTDLALEVADGSIAGDLGAIAPSIADARDAVAATRGLVRYAVGYNVAGVTLAAAGLLHPVLAAALMAASSLAVTLRCTLRAETRSSR